MIAIYPRNMYYYTKITGNTSSSYKDISLQTLNVNLMVALQDQKAKRLLKDLSTMDYEYLWESVLQSR